MYDIVCCVKLSWSTTKKLSLLGIISLFLCKRVDGQLYYRCPDGKVGMPLLETGFIDRSYLKESTIENSDSECESCATGDTATDTEEGEEKKETDV